MEIKVNGKNRKFVLGEGAKSTSGDKVTKEDIEQYLVKDDSWKKYYIYFFESKVVSAADAINREEAINGIYDELKELGHGGFLLIKLEVGDVNKNK